MFIKHLLHAITVQAGRAVVVGCSLEEKTNVNHVFFKQSGVLLANIEACRRADYRPPDLKSQGPEEASFVQNAPVTVRVVAVGV